jgi:hypothetical protein
METTQEDSIDEHAPEEGAGGSAAAPNLSLIDQITIDYMTNRYQKNAVDRFFSQDVAPPAPPSHTDTRIYEYEPYQEKAKELFSQLLDDFMLFDGDEGLSTICYEVRSKFHAFMSAAISHFQGEESGN